MRLKESANVSLLLQLGDKGLSFLSPLLILYMFQNENMYVSLEYILSLSLLVLAFSDMGIKSYITFSGFKLENKNLQNDVIGSIYLISVVGLVLIILSYLASSFLCLIDRMATLVLIQTISLTLLSIYAQTFIVRGFPAFHNLIGLIVKTVTVGILGIIYLYNVELKLEYFFISNIVLVLFALYFSFRKSRSGNVSLGKALFFIRKSIIYSWPLLLSTLFSLFVMNFAKIYSFSSLETNVTTGFFFWSRLIFIIQLVHLAITPILMERIYKGDSATVIRGGVMRIYSMAITLGCFGVLVLYILFTSTDVIAAPPFGFIDFSILLLYAITWCFSAFFEAFYSSENRNKVILLYSSISVAIYGISMIMLRPTSVRGILVIMLVAGIVYNILLIITASGNNTSVK
jgi:O-antigen/teichoic acid export membrane protein